MFLTYKVYELFQMQMIMMVPLFVFDQPMVATERREIGVGV